MRLSLGHERSVPDIYAMLGTKKRRAKTEDLAPALQKSVPCGQEKLFKSRAAGLPFLRVEDE